MEFPSILNIFLVLSLLTMTTNINLTCAANTKLFSDICKKTTSPTVCYRIVTNDHFTSEASTLDDLGVGFLDIAIIKARQSMNVFILKLKYSKEMPYLKVRYLGCRDRYKSAMNMLIQARRMLIEKNISPARGIVEHVSRVPGYCRKEPSRNEYDVADANQTSDIIFNIALVIMKELEASKKMIVDAVYV